MIMKKLIDLYEDRNLVKKDALLVLVTIWISMGEAKRRKEQGLPPREPKKDKNDESTNLFKKFRRNQILPVVLALGFIIFLIFDLINYYKN